MTDVATEKLRRLAADALAQFPRDWRQQQFSPDFTDPGWSDPRLLGAAVNAISSSPRNWDGAKDALFRAVRNDADLLWALLGPYRLAAAQRLLTDVNADLRSGVLQPSRLPNVTIPKFQPPPPRPAPVVAREADRPVRPSAARDIGGMAAVGQAAARSLLDSMRWGGKRLGDMTPRAAERFAETRERDGRFIRLLIQNLPPDQPIRKYRTPEAAQEIFDAATKEYANEHKE